MPLHDTRTMDRALADLIKRRQQNFLLSAERVLLDRMIDDLKIEISLHCCNRGAADNRYAVASPAGPLAPET